MELFSIFRGYVVETECSRNGIDENKKGLCYDFVEYVLQIEIGE